MKRHSKELDIKITAEKTMEKYKRWKERTSTSPSGCPVSTIEGER
jgi:hypothetical protein